jgi:LuxR family quorum sensing-dependent transcriptional regulator
MAPLSGKAASQTSSMEFVTQHTIRFIEDLERVRDFVELDTFMRATMAGLGMHYYSFYEPQKTKAGKILGIHLHNVPGDWLQYYLEQGYDSVNPILRKVYRTRSPFLWSTLGPEGYLANKRSRKMLSESGDAGLRDGFVFPILHCNGEMVLITLATDRMDDDPRLEPTLRLVSLYLHDKFKSMRGGDPETPISPLSEQETECLHWAGAGKTDWVIGEIMGISESSVRTYFRRAKHKLGVTSKMQAIVAATRRGIIRP